MAAFFSQADQTGTPHLDRRSPIFEASDPGVGEYLRLIRFQADFPSEGKMCS